MKKRWERERERERERESTNMKTEADVQNSKAEPYSLKPVMCNASITLWAIYIVLLTNCVRPTIKLPWILLKKSVNLFSLMIIIL